MLRVYDEFAGVGGTSHGASYVPNVTIYAAANHDKHAVDSHSLNFPGARHFQADITKLPVDKMPYAEIFSASPACPAWTNANGVKVEFDRVNVERRQLFDLPEDEPTPKMKKKLEEYRRSRLLMKEIPRYLRAMNDRGTPVLAGMVENVIQCRKWAEWDHWIREIRNIGKGYDLWILAVNAMHAEPVRALKTPQSRNRLIIGYVHKSLGRVPDWDKWLRPHAYCPSCDETVQALKVWKKPGIDMGAYGTQYVFQCPRVSCRGREVFPQTLPALAAIDPGIPGIRIGDRAQHKLDPLADATMDRIRTGVRRFWAPLMVPVEGRPGKTAAPASVPLRTQTTRNETGFAIPPTLPMFIAPLRGGGDRDNARSIDDPLSTVTASGNHHGLAIPSDGQQAAFQAQLLVPYYGSSTSALPATEPIGTLPTHDRYGIAAPDLEALTAGFDLDDVLFRMLEPHEVARAQSFAPSYLTSTKTKRINVRLFGNAVPASIAEVVMSALVECITGDELERFVSQGDLAMAA